MRTQAHEIYTLRCRYEALARSLQEPIGDERLHYQRTGKLRVLTAASQKLMPIRVTMGPDLVENTVLSLLNWLVGQKMCWMCGKLRRRSSDEQWKTWQTEGAIEQIESVVREVGQTFPSTWEQSPARHGRGFQVFHCRDLMRGSTSVDCVRQRWCGPEREQWYQTVAIISVKHAQRQLVEVFQVTNHRDHPWPRHREVAWSLDMHTLAIRIAAHSVQTVTGPSYPRSTSVGDILVSLLSGTTWMVAPFGFQVLNEDICYLSL